MHQLTTITRTSDAHLPENLALLAAPILGDAFSPETEPLGHTEGAIVDEAGHVVFFVARVAQNNRPTGKRILVPLAALSVEQSAASAYQGKLVLRTSWTRDQMLAQPDFSDDYQLPKNRVDGSPPLSGRWAPAVPNVIPPGSGVNRPKAARFAMLWGALGTLGGLAVGAVIGVVAGSTFAAVATSIFFGLAAGIAGAIAGATRDSAVDAGEIHAPNAATSGENLGTIGTGYIRALEQALQDRALLTLGMLKSTLILPTLQTVRASEGTRTPSLIDASKPLRT